MTVDYIMLYIIIYLFDGGHLGLDAVFSPVFYPVFSLIFCPVFSPVLNPVFGPVFCPAFCAVLHLLLCGTCYPLTIVIHVVSK